MKQVIQSLLIIVAVAVLLSVCGRKGPEGPPDTTPPVVVGTSPADQSLEVPADTSLSVTFSEPVSESTVALVLVDITNHIPSVPMSMSSSGATVVFTPAGMLKLDSLYGATVRAGAKDTAGNSLVADHTWYFRTSASVVNSPSHTVTAKAGANGTINPSGAIQVKHNVTQSFTVTPIAGYHIASATGCGGTLNGTTYTTAPVAADCTVTASFSADAPATHTVTAHAGANGRIEPGTATVADGGTAQFTVTPSAGYHIDSVSGCAGTLSGNTYTTGPVTANCTVTASFAADAPATHTVIAKSGANGSIEPGTATVADGGTAQFTITPSTGYHIDSVTGCGGTLSGNSYTTGSVRADCTVTASFKENAPSTHKIEATAESHGEIIPSGTIIVVDGQDKSFEIKSDFGYVINEVSVDGKAVDVPRSTSFTYTFPNVTRDHTIKARFKALWKISASAGANGSITPSGTVMVEEGADQAFVIMPVSADYAIQDVVVDNSSVGSVPNYTFIAVSADHTITASFAQNAPASFTVSPVAGPNGSITPAEPQTVRSGEAAAFTVTANADYHILSVTGCEGTLSGNTYTTGPITAACTVAASFEADTLATHVVNAKADKHGAINPEGHVQVTHGEIAVFAISAEEDYGIANPVAGTCGGTLSENTYMTAPVLADCTVEVHFTRTESWLSRSYVREALSAIDPGNGKDAGAGRPATDKRSGTAVAAAAI